MERSDIDSLIPRNKHDFERVEALACLQYEKVAPVLPQLFEWIADGNWPIAGRLARYLLNLQPAPYEVIREILAGSDASAKWFLLQDLMRFMPRQAAEPLRVSIERLSQSTGGREVAEEVNLVAAEVLAWLDKATGRD